MKPLKHSLGFALAIASLTTVALNAADSPKDAVKAAAKALGEKPNYSYNSTPKSEGGQGSRFIGPSEGKVEKGGFAYVKATVGENTFETVRKGEKSVSKGQDGTWRTAEELREAFAKGGGAKKGGGQGGGRGFFGAGRTLRLPAEQAADLVDKSAELKEADGAFAGDLTTEGAKELMSFGGQGLQISGAKASVKFWIKDGVLSKYEYHTQGSISFNGNDIDINRTTTIEIKDVGTTTVKVPEEAKAKL